LPGSERTYEGRNEPLRRKKALKTVAVILGVFALLFVTYEIFTLKTIMVTGCVKVPEEEIVALCGLKTGDSVFFIDTAKAQEALSSDFRIKVLGVTVEYPDRVVIAVKERNPAACIIKSDTMLVIDEEGYLLEIAEKPDKPPYPAVMGLSLEEYSTGARLGASDAFQLDVLCEVLAETANAGVEIQSVDVSIPADVAIALKDGFTVELGDDLDLGRKLEIAKASVRKLKEMGKTGGVVNVSSGKDARYLEK